MNFDRDELIGQLYAYNLLLKAKVKLLLHLIMLIASKENHELDASKILDVYNDKIESYYEDQQLLSPLRDDFLEYFLQKLKDELK
ncbi:MAG: hypothetical protein ACTHNW_21990 [Mucilaginibacter sp.]